MVRLDEDRRQVRAAQARFLLAARAADAARPTSLPGWTAGHLLTHVARNADSHRRRAEAAARDEVVDQYPGGYAARAAAIDAGASRPTSVLLDDVRRSADAMEASWDAAPPHAWDRVTRDVSGRARPLRELPARRWQELEVHVVDLDVGVTPADWSDAFVAAWLEPLRATVAARLPAGAAVPRGLDARTELGWLYGRVSRPNLPVLAPWG